MAGEAERFIQAAMRYCVVADWFETVPPNLREPAADHPLMELFNQVEAELRDAARPVLSQERRVRVLVDAGVPLEWALKPKQRPQEATVQPRGGRDTGT